MCGIESVKWEKVKILDREGTLMVKCSLVRKKGIDQAANKRAGLQ